MLIEFDETKRARTLQERGLDFAEAGQVLDGMQLTQADVRQDQSELSNVTSGALAGHMVVVVWIPRGAAHEVCQ